MCGRHWAGDRSRGGARSPPRPRGTGSPTGRGWPGCSAPPAPGPGAACWTWSPVTRGYQGVTRGSHWTSHHSTKEVKLEVPETRGHDGCYPRSHYDGLCVGCGQWLVWQWSPLLHSTLTQSPLRPRPTPGPPLNHGLGHLATRHSNNEYYCRLMHFYHHLWQCAEQVSYCESYHKANQGNDAMNI